MGERDEDDEVRRLLRAVPPPSAPQNLTRRLKASRAQSDVSRETARLPPMPATNVTVAREQNRWVVGIVFATLLILIGTTSVLVVTGRSTADVHDQLEAATEADAIMITSSGAQYEGAAFAERAADALRTQRPHLGMAEGGVPRAPQPVPAVVGALPASLAHAKNTADVQRIIVCLRRLELPLSAVERIDHGLLEDTEVAIVVTREAGKRVVRALDNNCPLFSDVVLRGPEEMR